MWMGPRSFNSRVKRCLGMLWFSSLAIQIISKRNNWRVKLIIWKIKWVLLELLWVIVWQILILWKLIILVRNQAQPRYQLNKMTGYLSLKTKHIRALSKTLAFNKSKINLSNNRNCLPPATCMKIGRIPAVLKSITRMTMRKLLRIALAKIIKIFQHTPLKMTHRITWCKCIPSKFY